MFDLCPYRLLRDAAVQCLLQACRALRVSLGSARALTSTRCPAQGPRHPWTGDFAGAHRVRSICGTTAQACPVRARPRLAAHTPTASTVLAVLLLAVTLSLCLLHLQQTWRQHVDALGNRTCRHAEAAEAPAAKAGAGGKPVRRSPSSAKRRLPPKRGRAPASATSPQARPLSLPQICMNVRGPLLHALVHAPRDAGAAALTRCSCCQISVLMPLLLPPLTLPSCLSRGSRPH